MVNGGNLRNGFIFNSKAVAHDCQTRDYGWGSFVCVCSPKRCDFVGDIGGLLSGAAVVFESSKAGLRFAKTTTTFGETTDVADGEESEVLLINSSRTYQRVLGFGGAFTDSVGINLNSLPTNMRDYILKSYYSKEGIEYNMGRIPLASTDFSVRKYTYDDSPDDFELKNFTLAPEDFDLKIPYIKKAMSLSGDFVWFFGSSWSSPAWMKTNGELEGLGFLKGQPGGPYYKTWAKYHVRFVEEYEKQGVPIWGMTTQNEPTSGFVPFYPWQTLGFTPWSQRDFVKLDLGPALEEAGYGEGKVKVMIFDDNRLFLPFWANVVLSDDEAAKYVHGVGVHWYKNKFIGPSVLDDVRENFPDKFILATEACTGYETMTLNKVKLGSWDRAERYASDIIEDLNHGVGGWTDWNLVLNTEGGPNWVGNYVDSPIIVNATAEEFYKQPMYYAMGHFSKFIPRGSIRIFSSMEQNDILDIFGKELEHTAFLRPDSAVVVVVLNRGDRHVKLKIKDQVSCVSFQKIIKERSIATFIWKPERERET
ncbi:lysosomal acid glucosylceramidase-like [Rhipicephalus sanguineus]|uniref:lysosomal acid glucosylceramidase-like n=1 Tax=Rhipicephalus sanguineus TaxID=34632 RepID=UPI00189401D1|nr:lysosomal acid glucosylceramidase-like [Rhipicephalus sanguineus]